MASVTPAGGASNSSRQFSPHYLIAIVIALAGVVLIFTIALAWIGVFVLLAGIAYGAIARWINVKRSQ